MISSAVAPSALPTSRLANASASGSAGPAVGTPTSAAPRRPASWRTVRSPGVTTVKRCGRPDRTPAKGLGHGAGASAASGVAAVNCTRSPGARRANGGWPARRVTRPSGPPGAIRRARPTGRRRRGRWPGPPNRPAPQAGDGARRGTAAQGLGQAVEIGEARGEADHGHAAAAHRSPAPPPRRADRPASSATSPRSGPSKRQAMVTRCTRGRGGRIGPPGRSRSG